MEEIPTAIELGDGAMSCPADDRLEKDTAKEEWTVGIVTYGVAHEMCVAGRVSEVVATFILMHPRCLKETVRVCGSKRFARIVDDNDRARSLSKLKHVVSHASHAARQCLLVALGQVLHAKSHVVAITLQLSSPDATEVDVYLSIVVLKDAWVDGIGATDGVRLRMEGAFGLVGGGNAEVEDAVLVLGAEDHIVSSVLLHYVVVPELFSSPRNILNLQGKTVVVGNVLIGAVKRQDVVVFHLEVAAIIVEGFARVPVVGGIDIQFVVKDVG